MSIKNVCVYCGSSNHVDEEYKSVAHAVGTLLAQNNMNIIYGGGHVGLMGILADAALASGGSVIGIIPEYLHSRESQHNGLTELHVVSCMHERKKMMEDRSDAFLVLPGGFGTLDEVFEILTWKELGLHNKNVVIYNQNGFWDPMLSLIKHVIRNGFAPNHDDALYHVVTSIEEVMPTLSGPEDAFSDPREKWT